MPPKAKGGGGSKGGGGGLSHTDRQLPEAAKKKQSKQSADRQAAKIAKKRLQLQRKVRLLSHWRRYARVSGIFDECQKEIEKEA